MSKALRQLRFEMRAAEAAFRNHCVDAGLSAKEIRAEREFCRKLARTTRYSMPQLLRNSVLRAILRSNRSAQVPLP